MPITIAGSGTVDTNGHNVTVGGNVSDPEGIGTGTAIGNGTLIKTGAGTLTLSGENNYEGGTTVLGGLIVFPTAQRAAAARRETRPPPNHANTLPEMETLTIAQGTKAVLGTATGDGNGDGQNTDHGTGHLSSGQLSGGGSTPTDVVEFYLQPISYGTTSYTTDFESGQRTTRLSMNERRYEWPSRDGTYLAVYAGLNQADQTHSDDGVQGAELNFTSSGHDWRRLLAGTDARGVALGSGPVASTGGSSTDLNGDGNLDLG